MLILNQHLSRTADHRSRQVRTSMRLNLPILRVSPPVILRTIHTNEGSDFSRKNDALHVTPRTGNLSPKSVRVPSELSLEC